MRFRYNYAILVLLACGPSLQSQPIVTSGFTFPTVQAGQKATLTGTGLNAVTVVTLQLEGKPTPADIDVSTKTDTSLSFSVRPLTATGTYTVVLTPGGPIPPKLSVTAAPAAVPEAA